MKRYITFIMIALIIIGVCAPAGTAIAKSKSPDTIYNSVKKKYGTKFPLSTANEIHTQRKNIFNAYSTVLGVSAKYFSSYKAARRATSKEEQICFICKAVSDSSVKKIKKSLKKYVKNEIKGNENYHSAKGKKLMKNARIGSKGKYVYLFIIDTSKNKKAVKAFNLAS